MDRIHREIKFRYVYSFNGIQKKNICTYLYYIVFLPRAILN